jgi:hypothetical protein
MRNLLIYFTYIGKYINLCKVANVGYLGVEGRIILKSLLKI